MLIFFSRHWVIRFALSAAIIAAPLIVSASPETHGRVRPLRQIYKTHQGWEYRTEHFITVATTSGDDARWGGEELEAAWEETARLADHFGEMHRRPDFGMVGALMTKNSTVPRTTGTRYPKLTLPPNPTVIQVQISEDHQASRVAARQTLRRGAAATLLRQSGYDERLPKWAAIGLTEFVADEPWDAARLEHERHTAQQTDAELPEWNVVFRHLMTSDDGSQAAEILASIADYGDFSAGRLARRIPIHTRWNKITARRAEEALLDSRPPQLPDLSRSELRQRIAKWLADPQMGATPISTNIAGNDSAARRVQEMALLVNLWQRHGKETSSPDANQASAPIDLERLHRRLTSSTAPAWSAVDVDGRLLTWRDQKRIDSLFSIQRGKYLTKMRAGHSVLQYREPDGKLMEAWLDRGIAPAQPVIYVQRTKRL